MQQLSAILPDTGWHCSLQYWIQPCNVVVSASLRICLNVTAVHQTCGCNFCLGGAALMPNKFKITDQCGHTWNAKQLKNHVTHYLTLLAAFYLHIAHQWSLMLSCKIEAQLYHDMIGRRKSVLWAHTQAEAETLEALKDVKVSPRPSIKTR